MAKAEMPPEAADKGYWYVTPVVSYSDQTGASLGPAHIPKNIWSAWYGEVDGVTYAAIRTPEPVYGVTTAPVSVNRVLQAAGFNKKPRARINGK